MSLRKKILIIFAVVSLSMVIAIGGFISYMFSLFQEEVTSTDKLFTNEVYALFSARIEEKIGNGDRLSSFMDEEEPLQVIMSISQVDLIIDNDQDVLESAIIKVFEVEGERVVLYRVDRPLVLAENTRFWISPLFLFSGFMILIQIAILYGLFRWVLKPLKQLEIGTREIAEGNLEVTLPNYGANDEIGQLFTSFDSMRKQLSEDEKLRSLYEKNRTELIANISHDLKTPIAAIKGYSTGILEGVANTEERLDKYVRVIHQNAASMDVMLNDLVTLSNLDLKHESLMLESINITQFFNDFFDEWEYELESKNIHFATMINVDGERMIKADRLQLMRVINNLMSNAIKYMNKEKQKIKIEVVEQQQQLMIKITDNGMGIPKSKLDRVFERFYRVDEARSRKIDGSGLGLSIVKNIVNLHKGTIRMESIDGVGTTVILTLPL